jgi:hypothetical protein
MVVRSRLIDGGKVVSPYYRPLSLTQKRYFSASGTTGPSTPGRIR